MQRKICFPSTSKLLSVLAICPSRPPGSGQQAAFSLANRPAAARIATPLHYVGLSTDLSGCAMSKFSQASHNCVMSSNVLNPLRPLPWVSCSRQMQSKTSCTDTDTCSFIIHTEVRRSASCFKYSTCPAIARCRISCHVDICPLCLSRTSSPP